MKQVDENNVGFVEKKFYTIKEDLNLESNAILKNPTIAYETYGTLNTQKNNAILICHPLTADSHVAGYNKKKEKGWWDIIIGPEKAIDTNKYYVICSNVLGGCKGTTGPKSINPETNEEYGLNFPIVTILDMIKAQKKLITHLDIQQLFAVIGGSMGGMQVLQWCVSYPSMVKNAIAIATSAYSTAQQIAFNEVGRRSIIDDPKWNHGQYYKNLKTPDKGLALARMIAHITYLSKESMLKKFSRNLQDKEEYSFNFETEFQVESYLKHQGNTFTKRFDANSYLYLTKAFDYFDLRENKSLEDGLKSIKTRLLLVGISSDWLFSIKDMKKILMALNKNNADVKYAELNSEYGHDAFLIESGQLTYMISNFLSKATVKDVMNTQFKYLHKDSSIKKASKMMLDHNITHILILSENNHLEGIVTSWDLLESITKDKILLKNVMTKKVITCQDDDQINKVARIMNKHNLSSLPVLNKDKKVIGIISTDHISNLYNTSKC
ncbi:MAG: homoserine O-acetyltransferase [Methanobacteriaceae archaeon]|nr:homoserine O-acetyltransferase [Methanobacteriaceae archaeon]